MQKCKRILIAGSAGFIGSHIVEKLLDLGHSIIGVDNLITGTEKNYIHLISHPNFEFINADISNNIPDVSECAMIINLACPASPIDYQNIPIETLWTSAMGTKNLLDLANSSGAVFLHASTSEVYGDPLVHPQKEDYFGNVNPIGPRSCYDEGKRFAESLIVNYQKVHALDTRIFRIFNTYGPRMRKNDGRVIPNFINQALEGNPITIYGDGKQTRSFCYVDDMVEGILKVAVCEKFNGPVNLGNPNEISILELAELIIQMTGSESKIEFKNMPIDDPKIRKPDISKAIKELNFSLKIDLVVGLRKTIDYFKGL